MLIKIYKLDVVEGFYIPDANLTITNSESFGLFHYIDNIHDVHVSVVNSHLFLITEWFDGLDWEVKTGVLNFSLNNLSYSHNFYSYDFSSTKLLKFKHTYLLLRSSYAIGKYVFIDKDGYVFWNYTHLVNNHDINHSVSLLKSYKIMPKDKSGNSIKLSEGLCSIENLSGEGISSKFAIFVAEKDTPRKTVIVKFEMDSENPYIDLSIIDQLDAAVAHRDFRNQTSPRASWTLTHDNTIYSLIMSFAPYYGTYEEFKISKYALEGYDVYTVMLTVFRHDSLSMSHFEVHFPILILRTSSGDLGLKSVGLIHNKSTSSIFVNFTRISLRKWREHPFNYDMAKFNSQRVKIIPVANLMSMI